MTALLKVWSRTSFHGHMTQRRLHDNADSTWRSRHRLAFCSLLPLSVRVDAPKLMPNRRRKKLCTGDRQLFGPAVGNSSPARDRKLFARPWRWHEAAVAWRFNVPSSYRVICLRSIPEHPSDDGEQSTAFPLDRGPTVREKGNRSPFFLETPDSGVNAKPEVQIAFAFIARESGHFPQKQIGCSWHGNRTGSKIEQIEAVVGRTEVHDGERNQVISSTCLQEACRVRAIEVPGYAAEDFLVSSAQISFRYEVLDQRFV